jgi:uncharacterized membrane protein YccC
MTDIVERLRVFATQRYDDQLVTEAADEIERLRNLLDAALTNCAEAADEIERLRAVLWRISAGDPTHSQFAVLAISEARAAVETYKRPSK